MANILTSNRLSSIDYIFDNFFNGLDYGKYGNRLVKTNNVPAANTKKTDAGFEIQLAAPGLSKNSFSISIEKNLMTISSSDKSNLDKSTSNSEFNYSNFTRSWILPESCMKNKIKANYDLGILTVTIPIENKKEQFNITVE